MHMSNLPSKSFFSLLYYRKARAVILIFLYFFLLSYFFSLDFFVLNEEPL